MNRRFATLLTVVLLAVPISFAQIDLAAGILPFSTQVGGAVDSVDLATGNIFINIPVRNKTGKIPFSYSLVGNSHLYVYPGSSSWYSSMSLSGQALAGDLGAHAVATTTAYYCNGTNLDNQFTNIAIIDATGAAHPVGNRIWNETGYIAGPGGCSQAIAVPTSDGSGYTLVIPAVNTKKAFSQLPMTIYDKFGNAVTFPNGGYSPATMTDPDGVVMKVVGGTYTDTLGQTALTVTYNGGPTSDTYVYTDASKNNQTFTVAYSQSLLSKLAGIEERE